MSADRELLIELYGAAVAGAAPGPATGRAVDALGIPADRRVLLFAFGKAGHAMAAAAVDSLLRSLRQIVGGVLVTPEGAATPYPTIVSLPGDHPTPSRRSFDAATRIGEAAAGRRATDVALVLISGGTSSLIAAPLRGQNEGDLSGLFATLLDAGLDIARMNAIRKRFSRWGAGRLALALAPAATHCLAMSDVIGDDLSVIGSGPCVADPTTVSDVVQALEQERLLARLSPTHREYLTSVQRGTTPETPKRQHPAFAHITSRVIATNRLALDGVAVAARGRGFSAHIQQTPLWGEASAAADHVVRTLLDARRLVAEDGTGPRCYVWGGETTVRLSPGSRAAGGGGRCQELALAAARALAQAGDAGTGISILAAGTDGVDGSTDAAGAIVDGTTVSTIRAAGRDPETALMAHESNAALRAAGALIPRRATGTNVMDVVVGLVR